MADDGGAAGGCGSTAATGWRVALVLADLLLAAGAHAAPSIAQEAPAPVRAIGVDEHPGRKLPLEPTIHRRGGDTVPLGRFFASEPRVPVLLVPG